MSAPSLLAAVALVKAKEPRLMAAEDWQQSLAVLTLDVTKWLLGIVRVLPLD